eukprot:2304446-Pyramimonas_sp.AAC.1
MKLLVELDLRAVHLLRAHGSLELEHRAGVPEFPVPRLDAVVHQSAGIPGAEGYAGLVLRWRTPRSEAGVKQPSGSSRPRRRRR